MAFSTFSDFLKSKPTKKGFGGGGKSKDATAVAVYKLFLKEISAIVAEMKVSVISVAVMMDVYQFCWLKSQLNGGVPEKYHYKEGDDKSLTMHKRLTDSRFYSVSDYRDGGDGCLTFQDYDAKLGKVIHKENKGIKVMDAVTVKVAVLDSKKIAEALAEKPKEAAKK